jgi:hypothetical protein
MPSPVPGPPAVASIGQPEPQIPARLAMLSIRPAELAATQGAEVQCEVTMEGITGAVDSSVTLTYNPQVLELLRTLEGDLVTAGSGGSGVTVSAGSSPGPGGHRQAGLLSQISRPVADGRRSGVGQRTGRRACARDGGARAGDCAMSMWMRQKKE